MELKRGDIVTIALQGLFGQTRSAVIMQSDMFASHASVVVLPVTSELLDAPLFRVKLQRNPENGLEADSQIMVDKPQCIPREAISEVIGKLDEDTMGQVERAFTSFLALG